jgi:hypothetical protein
MSHIAVGFTSNGLLSRIGLRGKVFIETLSSNGSICHNMETNYWDRFIHHSISYDAICSSTLQNAHWVAGCCNLCVHQRLHFIWWRPSLWRHYVRFALPSWRILQEHWNLQRISLLRSFQSQWLDRLPRLLGFTLYTVIVLRVLINVFSVFNV